MNDILGEHRDAKELRYSPSNEDFTVFDWETHEKLKGVEIIVRLNKQNSLIKDLSDERDFYKKIVEEVSYSLVDFNRLKLNKEVNECLSECESLDEFKEMINKGKEVFKQEYKWLR